MDNIWLDDVIVDECFDEVIPGIYMLGLLMKYWILGHIYCYFP